MGGRKRAVVSWYNKRNAGLRKVDVQGSERAVPRDRASNAQTPVTAPAAPVLARRRIRAQGNQTRAEAASEAGWPKVECSSSHHLHTLSFHNYKRQK